MTAGTWAAVAMAGAAGALLRHEVTARAGRPLLVLHACNVAGAFALALLVGIGPPDRLGVALTAGGLGALTSFSTWVVGARQGDALRELGPPLVVVVVAAILGTLLGRAVAGGP